MKSERDISMLLVSIERLKSTKWILLILNIEGFRISYKRICFRERWFTDSCERVCSVVDAAPVSEMVFMITDKVLYSAKNAMQL